MTEVSVSKPDANSSGAADRDAGLAACTLRDLTLYFLRLGTFGFGGPIALAGYMQRDLVEHRRWISRQDYTEGLALAQLAPGPLAAQLAIYLGWVRGGVFGATLVGFAFVIPSFLMVLLLAALYVRYGGLSWMQGAFYGIGAAVIAIIARSVVKLGRMTLARDRLLWTVFALSAVVTAWTESEIAWIFIASGVVTMMLKAPPKRAAGSAALGLLPPALLSGIHGPATAATLWKIAWYFAEAGAFVFGSGLAIVPFLYGGVVQEFQWTGAIAGAGFVLGKRAIVDLTTLAICVVTLVVISELKKAPEPLVIAVAGAAGVVMHAFGLAQSVGR